PPMSTASPMTAPNPFRIFLNMSALPFFKSGVPCGGTNVLLRPRRRVDAEKPCADAGFEVLAELRVLLADLPNRLAQPALHVDARALGDRARLALAPRKSERPRQLVAERLELTARARLERRVVILSRLIELGLQLTRARLIRLTRL